jgi:hypothetical protein
MKEVSFYQALGSIGLPEYDPNEEFMSDERPSYPDTFLHNVRDNLSIKSKSKLSMEDIRDVVESTLRNVGIGNVRAIDEE